MTTVNLKEIPNPFMEMVNTIDLHTWRRNALGSEQDGFCIAGAYGHLCLLSGELFDHENVRIAMTNIMIQHLPKGQTIFSFNDRIARDDAEIRELLKHCAQDWDAKYGF